MDNAMYLIHADDYISHIDEKIALYMMVKQLTHMVEKLPAGHGSKALSDMAHIYASVSEEMFASWGIPASYLVFDNKEELSELMENELIAPEDAGYCPCGLECCGNCGCPCGEDAGEADDGDMADDEVVSMIADLSDAIHKIFGDKVTVHIMVEG